MTDLITEFDRDRYAGQVHAWVTDDGKTVNGKPLVSVYICRRYTNEEYNDDDQWGIWLHVNGTDHADIATKLLHFCDACGYEVVSLNDAHANDPDSPLHEEEAIGNPVGLVTYNVMSQQIYDIYISEVAKKAKDVMSEFGDSAKEELRTLFASFSAVQQLGFGPK